MAHCAKFEGSVTTSKCRKHKVCRISVQWNYMQVSLYLSVYLVKVSVCPRKKKDMGERLAKVPRFVTVNSTGWSAGTFFWLWSDICVPLVIVSWLVRRVIFLLHRESMDPAEYPTGHRNHFCSMRGELMTTCRWHPPVSTGYRYSCCRVVFFSCCFC